MKILRSFENRAPDLQAYFTGALRRGRDRSYSANLQPDVGLVVYKLLITNTAFKLVITRLSSNRWNDYED